MRVAILAGGMGRRLRDGAQSAPKPLVEIGGRPILWHVMHLYARRGFDDFVVALGDRGDEVRRRLAAIAAQTGWRIEAIDTGADTETGGRLKRLAPRLGGQTFMLTWCDGLADIDPHALLAFHAAHGRLATLTAVHPPPRFGRLRLDGNFVDDFAEKAGVQEWINGAFFVLEPGVLDHIDGDRTSWERESLPRLARSRQLMAYRHGGFWQCMDTPAERDILEALWRSGAAPWRGGG